MKNKSLEVVATLECAGKSCPTIYKDEDGKVFIQGPRLRDELMQAINVGDNEEVVEISPEMLQVLRTM
jgi:hypothetical protein